MAWCCWVNRSDAANILMKVKEFRKMIPEYETKCCRNHLFVTDIELKSKTQNNDGTDENSESTNLSLDVKVSGNLRRELQERPEEN